MEKVGEVIIRLAPTTSVDELYTMLQEELEQSTKDHIRTITTRKGTHLPFIDKQLQKLITKRDKAYVKKQKNRHSIHSNSYHTQELDDIFQDMKCQVQKELRRAYWSYVESLITPMDPDSPEQNYMGMVLH